MGFIGDTATWFWSVFRTVRFADIIDIAAVAFIIYKVITFVSRTGSARVIRGILLLIAAMWLSNLLQLSVISFLMGKTVELGFLAIIILFQPELRRMLERVGSSNITQLFNRIAGPVEMESAISQTVIACTDMSHSRIGAIVVFERTIKIDDPIKTGTILNADTQADLLKNIFYPKAPLHDGAVIIRGAKIAAAGCMLPLSTNPNISKELGTRHRAGIGISENSDAVVAIVSEENGSISVAVDGMLKRRLTADTFERLLRNELLQENRENRRKKLLNKISKRNYK